MNTNTYAATINAMQADLEQAELDAKRLRAAIKAVTELCGQAAPARRNATPAGSRPEVPTELANLSHGDRILHVMNAEPDKAWKVADLAKAAYTGTPETARTTLKRLAEAGKVSITDESTWRLTRAGTPAL